MQGGVVPGGIWRTLAVPTAVNCAIAMSILAPGWKNTLVILRPFTVCDSMCSMSLTAVVSERSYCEPIRSSISSALKPV